MIRAGAGMFGAGKQRKQDSRRLWRGVTAAAAAGALLAGCGAGGDKGGAASNGSGKPSAPAAGQKALTEADLKAAAFEDGERIGTYRAHEDAYGPLDENYTADPARCQPLVSLTHGATDHDPVAEVNRDVDIADEVMGVGVLVQLRSYEGATAAAVMKNLAAAGTACAGGFTEERALTHAKVLEVEPVKAPGIGDEALAYHLTVLDVKGKLKLHEYLTVVRSGSTTLSFRGEYLGTKDIKEVPPEIIDAQWKKFRAGRTGGV
ncbi:hypothetical protein [Streptomyces sp. NPDC002889]|uniref:hypothetical protein n=1 Tax=Streptomyces sp. NPDC002889 TaxID=3364669 RepID=UPI0036B2A1F5